MAEYEKTRDAHSAYFLAELQRHEAEIKGRGQVEAMAEVEADLENVRSAWKWALNRHDAAGIGGALECLHIFCDLRGRYHEGAEFFSKAVAAFSPSDVDEAPSLLLGRLLLRFVFLRVFTPASWPEARSDLPTAVSIIEQHDATEEKLIAYLAVATYSLFAEGRPAEALSYYAKCLALSQEVGETYYRVAVLLGLGSCHGILAMPEEFERYTRAAIELAATSGNKVGCAMARANLAEYLLGIGEYDAAERHWHEAIALGQEAENPAVVSYSQALLGFVSFLRGGTVEPATAVQVSLSIAEKISYAISSAYAGAVLSLWQCVQGDYLTAKAWAERSLANTTNNTLGLVLAHWGLSMACRGLGRQQEARNALGDALRQVDSLQLEAAPVWLLPLTAVLLADEGERQWAAELLGLADHHPLSQMAWTTHWPILAEVRAALAQELGDEAYAAALARGGEMAVDTAVDTAVARLLNHFPRQKVAG